MITANLCGLLFFYHFEYSKDGLPLPIQFFYQSDLRITEAIAVVARVWFEAGFGRLSC